MTLREELEILRGEPIQVFTGDPMDIPCNETSDAEKLCQNPVVSVWMITYNHEPYIRQAIEGVVMQKTDFAYELVIGEDCSTDRTREICFEYQKKYPDKIRVLWSEQNLYRNPHPAGANGRRTMAHCRGEFIAFCEGDDYWIDPLKLQKQVDIMRKHPTVGFCFCGAYDLYVNTGIFRDYYLDSTFPVGLISSRQYIEMNLYGSGKAPRLGRESYVRTTTSLIRSSIFKTAREKFGLLSWGLRLGDVPIWLSVATLSDVYYLQDRVAVYRITNTGACAVLGDMLWKDNLLTRLYFYVIWESQFKTTSTYLSHNYFKFLYLSLIQDPSKCGKTIIRRVNTLHSYRWLKRGSRLFCIAMRLNAVSPFWRKRIERFYRLTARVKQMVYRINAYLVVND